jgi:hypothetical protein
LAYAFSATPIQNRDQYNLAYFNMRQRDEVSQLHLFDRRHQNVFIANWFRQDFLTKGYTAMVNFHFNNDHGITPGDRARLKVAYLGFHGDGRIGTWAIHHAFYQAFGHDDKANGFDMSSDNPNFAGGGFQFWTGLSSVTASR